MPTLLPAKAKASRRQRRADVVADWTGAWAVSLGCAATAFATFVYFGVHDRLAATFILFAAAFLIFLASWVSEAQRHCE